jgi:hypothetical protein
MIIFIRSMVVGYPNNLKTAKLLVQETMAEK